MKAKSFLLLLVFLFLKVGLAHSLSHSFSHDDLDECEQCILIVDSNKTQTFDGANSSNNDDFIRKEVITKPILWLRPILNLYLDLLFQKIGLLDKSGQKY